MKFEKVLAEFAGTSSSPEGGDPSSFLRYKKLKKLLKAAAERADRAGAPTVTESEKEFIEMLQEDVKRINGYFMEQEEAAVIKLQELRDRRAALAADDDASDAERKELHAAFVNLHGELTLLFHYSTVNYAGILKILKKHDKLLGDGADRRAAYLEKLLKQPFTSTDSISRLVRAAEEEARSMSGSPRDKASGAGAAAAADAAEGNALLKRTRAALTMLEQLQQTAHTPSTLLPAGTVAGAAIPRDGKRLKKEISSN